MILVVISRVDGAMAVRGSADAAAGAKTAAGAATTTATTAAAGTRLGLVETLRRRSRV